MTWWKKAPPHATIEADQAVQRGRDQLVAAQRLRAQAAEVSVAASAALQKNHFGASVEAAMTWKATTR